MYHDFKIDKSSFKGDLILTRENETRIPRSALYEIQYKQMRENFVPLCKKSPVRYYSNRLKIITLVDPIHIEYELYNLAYKKIMFFYEDEFIEGTMSSGMTIIHS